MLQPDSTAVPASQRPYSYLEASRQALEECAHAVEGATPPHSCSTIRKMAEHSMEKEVSLYVATENLRSELQALLDTELLGEKQIEGPRTGYLTRPQAVVDIGVLRQSCEEVIGACKEIASDREEVNQFSMAVRKLASVLQLNTQEFLIDLRSIGVRNEVPEPLVTQVLHLGNALQGVVREVEMNFDGLLASATK